MPRKYRISLGDLSGEEGGQMYEGNWPKSAWLLTGPGPGYFLRKLEASYGR